MRVLLPLLLLAATSGASAAPDPSLTLAPDSENRWVPFTLTPGNQLQFTAQRDGGPAAAILDTGASVSLVTRSFATRTGRKVEARGQLAAIGGTVATGWTAITSLHFGGVTRTGGGIGVVDLPQNVTGHGTGIELIVGRDLLDRYALELDYAGRRFRLLPSGRMPFTGARAPLRVGTAPLAYVTEVAIAGRRLRPVIVDTGDGTALTLARAQWRMLPFEQPPTMTTQLAYGVGGQVIADIGTLPSVTIGEEVARDVPVWVEQSGGFSDAARAAGRIGSGLLQRYRVLLDPAAGHMILTPTANPVALVASTSGLQLALAKGELRVLHVMRGSPADATGWKVGDRICAVDGVTVASDVAAAARATWPFGAPGTEVALTMCDGVNRTLTLRRFY